MTTIKNHKLIIWLGILTALLLVTGLIALWSATNPAAGPVVINEVMASNQSGLTDEDGDFSDWIELYNPTSQPVNLGGWSLTDDPDQPQKWPLPDTTLNGGDYLLVFASGKNRPVPNAPLHANFRLRKEGDFLGLYNILDQRFADTLEPRPHFPDMTFGRTADGLTLAYLAQPTPGQANDDSQKWADVVAPVQVSAGRGVYSQPVTVELSTNSPAAVIRYTTDGSAPSQDQGQLYTDPLAIESTTTLRAAAFKEGWLPSEVATHSYIYLDDILTQPANPPGFPQTWGTHQVDFKDFVAGTPVKPDYEMDPDIVNNPRYRDQLVEGLTNIPSLSIVTDMPNFADLYSNPQARGLDWERPVSVELITPNGAPGFQTEAGLRIQGGVGRNEFYPKHSFRLFFRNAYGPARLEYPLFPDSPVAEFDTLVLRGGVNRSFVGTFQNRQTTYTRDEWLRQSQIAMSGVAPQGIFVHLYINGLYWGLYNLTERPDAEFAASYLGGDPEDWLVVNHSGPVDGPENEQAALIEQYRAFVEASDNPQERANLRAQIESLVDIPQFVDYIIVNWYGGNQDWGENNWYAARHLPDGKLNYFVWDAEKTFFNGAKIYLGRSQASRPNVVIPLLNLLMDDPDFRQLFADRLYQHLFNHGALTDANARARWLALTNPLEQAIVAESARWGDGRSSDGLPITQDDWRAARSNVLNQIEGNAARLIQLARQAGFYPTIDPPAFNQPGGQVEPGFTLEMTTAQGDIYFTTDGSDPRQSGGDVALQALPYAGPVIITGTSTVKARVLEAGVWSALNQATFNVAEREGRLEITEILYNPPNTDNTEFIELQNIGGSDLNLAGLTFTEGIRFTFPADTLPLAPNELIVLAGNAGAFARQYPGVTVGGVFEGQLANQGETLTIHNPQGQVILSVTYNDENGWPLTPDGRGDSLVRIDPTANPNSPKSWQASPQLHGSPGVNNAVENASP